MLFKDIIKAGILFLVILMANGVARQRIQFTSTLHAHKGQITKKRSAKKSTPKTESSKATKKKDVYNPISSEIIKKAEILFKNNS